LRRVQTARGTREVQFLGDRHEVPQMPQFHPERLDGTAKNRNQERSPVSRATSYEGCDIDLYGAVHNMHNALRKSGLAALFWNRFQS
jgi:hypothetical protein